MKAKLAVVAMSGGVDSSVAAALLLEQGYKVVGLTMCFNLPEATRRPNCCGRQGIEDAATVSRKLGIRHYTLNMQRELEENVIKDFCREYLSGRTPNPCVRCNQFIKFDALLNKAISLGADFLATGHYARILKTESGYELRKARDRKKDQSYFLYRLTQTRLRRILFPLGNYTKEQVRGIASDLKLPVAHKPGSQEICFLPDMDYRIFLERRLGKGLRKGLVLDERGKVVGRHRGVAFYTIGQREGLGIALGYPAYITDIDAKNNTIRLGPRKEACASSFSVSDLHFICKKSQKKFAACVKIRYNHREEAARIELKGSTVALVTFRKPQFAVTPGQSAVFYNQDNCLGGGIIQGVLR